MLNELNQKLLIWLGVVVILVGGWAGFLVVIHPAWKWLEEAAVGERTPQQKRINREWDEKRQAAMWKRIKREGPKTRQEKRLVREVDAMWKSAETMLRADAGDKETEAQLWKEAEIEGNEEAKAMLWRLGKSRRVEEPRP